MTPDDAAAVRALSSRGKDWREIAKVLDLHPNAVRAQVDPEYRARCAASASYWRTQREIADRVKRQQMRDVVSGRDLTASLLGDPEPSRSALAAPRTLPKMRGPHCPARFLAPAPPPRTCSYPLLGDSGPGGDMLCCGKPVKRGSYCEEHAELCYRRRVVA